MDSVNTAIRKPDFITFTGIDVRTSLGRVLELSGRYPVEWAVLFSLDRQGEENRYPSKDFVAALKTLPFGKAAHLCGLHATCALHGIKASGLDLQYFDRFQINHRNPSDDAILAYARKYGGSGIMQVRGDEFPACNNCVQMLFDRSGGTGKVPDTWPRHPGGGVQVGYAGGINPDNVLDVIDAIGPDGPYWIDMESGVRTDDWFDLDKCEAVLQAVYGVGRSVDER